MCFGGYFGIRVGVEVGVFGGGGNGGLDRDVLVFGRGAGVRIVVGSEYLVVVVAHGDRRNGGIENGVFV